MKQAIISGHGSPQGRLPPWIVGASLGDGRGLAFEVSPGEAGRALRAEEGCG